MTIEYPKIASFVFKLTPSIVLILLILFGTTHYISDESWYLNQTGYFDKYGISLDTVRHWHGSSGPLFGLIHWIFSPITSLSLPAVRLVNVALFIGVITFQALSLRQIPSAHPSRKGLSWTNALWWFSIPVIWKLAGVAYTEMSALFCISVFLYFTTRIFCDSASCRLSPSRIGFFLIACLFLSLAICGRQPFAGVLVALVIAGLSHKIFHSFQYPRKTFFWIAMSILSAILPMIVFWQWHGLQPSHLANQPLNPLHGIAYTTISFGYLALIVLILKPEILEFTFNRSLLICAFIGGVITYFTHQTLVVPGMGIIGILKLPESLGFYIARSISFAMLALGAHFFWILLKSLWDARHDSWNFFLLICILGLCGSHLVIGPVFSSRYLTLALPFLFLWLNPNWSSRYAKARYTLGCSIGIFSLLGHLYQNQGPAFYDLRMEVFYPHLWEDSLPQVFSPIQWEKFDYGNSHWIQNPRYGKPITMPVEVNH